jgi:hypothetical protein
MFCGVAVQAVVCCVCHAVKKCGFGKVKRKRSEDGPGGPKHVGANVKKF